MHNARKLAIAFGFGVQGTDHLVHLSRLKTGQYYYPLQYDGKKTDSKAIRDSIQNTHKQRTIFFCFSEN